MAPVDPSNLTTSEVNSELLAGDDFLNEAEDSGQGFGSGRGPLLRVHPRSDIVAVVDVQRLISLLPAALAGSVPPRMRTAQFHPILLNRPGRLGSVGTYVPWTHPQRIQGVMMLVRFIFEDGTLDIHNPPCSGCASGPNSRTDPIYSSCASYGDSQLGACANCLFRQAGSRCEFSSAFPRINATEGNPYATQRRDLSGVTGTRRGTRSQGGPTTMLDMSKSRFRERSPVRGRQVPRRRSRSPDVDLTRDSRSPSGFHTPPERFRSVTATGRSDSPQQSRTDRVMVSIESSGGRRAESEGVGPDYGRQALNFSSLPPDDRTRTKGGNFWNDPLHKGRKDDDAPGGSGNADQV